MQGQGSEPGIKRELRCVSAGMHLAEGVASIMRIEAGSNVDKPHAISVNSAI